MSNNASGGSLQEMDLDRLDQTLTVIGGRPDPLTLMTGLEPTESSDQLASDSSPPRRRPEPLGL